MKVKARISNRRQLVYPVPSNSLVTSVRDNLAVSQLHTRSAKLATVNLEARSVDATLTTESPVLMYDWRSDRLFEEVLLTSGGRWRDNTTIYDNHMAYGSLSVLGSVNNRRIENHEWRGTLEFVNGEEEAEANRIWLRIERGHITGVSAGYQYNRANVAVIQPGSSKVIDGRKFTASADFEMRVVMQWEGYEVSVAPQQADPRSKMRSANETCPAATQVTDNFRLDTPALAVTAVSTAPVAVSTSIRSSQMGWLAFLRSLGLSDTATEVQVRTFHSMLGGDNRTSADALYKAEHDKDFVLEARAEKTGTEGELISVTTTLTPDVQTRAIEQAKAEERERVAQIRALGHGIDERLVSQAIDEDWNLAKVRKTFAPIVLERSKPVQQSNNVEEMTRTGQSPGQINGKGGPTLRTLQAALMLQSGIDLQNAKLSSAHARAMFRKEFVNANWLPQWNAAINSNGQADDESKRAVDEAWNFSSMRLVEFCRHAVALEGIAFSGYDERELVKRALSTATATALFTTNFQAELLMGYVGIEDSTRGWVKEIDVANWQPIERAQKGQVSRLRRQGRGAAPEHASFEVAKESLKVSTYSERWELTREDILDDRLSGLGTTPSELGLAAGELRPDLVYAILMTNPNLSDGNPLFSNAAGRINNLSTGLGSINSGSLDTLKTKFRLLKDNGRPIGERPRVLIVPETKEWTSQRVIGSVEERDPSATTDRGTMNPAKGKFRVVSDPRLDTGFINPFNDQEIAGQPGSLFLSSEPAEHGIAVAYLRADNRAPITESYSLTDGRIGLGMSLNMVIGVGPIGRVSIAKGTL